jgi:hypothetical protein
MHRINSDHANRLRISMMLLVWMFQLRTPKRRQDMLAHSLNIDAEETILEETSGNLTQWQVDGNGM